MRPRNIKFGGLAITSHPHILHVRKLRGLESESRCGPGKAQVESGVCLAEALSLVALKRQETIEQFSYGAFLRDAAAFRRKEYDPRSVSHFCISSPRLCFLQWLGLKHSPLAV